jgi:hypothetical protein
MLIVERLRVERHTLVNAWRPSEFTFRSDPLVEIDGQRSADREVCEIRFCSVIRFKEHETPAWERADFDASCSESGLLRVGAAGSEQRYDKCAEYAQHVNLL